MRIADALTGYWLDKRINLSHHTVSDYQLTLDRLLKYLCADFPIEEISADDVRRVLADVKAKPKLEERNQRVEQLVVRQKGQAPLVQTSAGGLREIVDQLPAALLGIDPEGKLVFMNHLACTLMPDAMGYLGSEPGGELATLLQRLASQPGAQPGQKVTLAHCPTPVRMWRQDLSTPSANRGELLMLLPWPQEVPA